MLSRQISIPTGTLAILSGLPGSGKSSLRKTAVRPLFSEASFIDTAWLSADELRKQLVGDFDDVDSLGAYRNIPQDCNPEIFAILRKQLQLRLARGLTTVIDACNPTEADRADWAALAKELGIPCKVFILDTSVDDTLSANRLRTHRVQDHSIRQMYAPPAPKVTQVAAPGKVVKLTPPDGFTLTSSLPYEVISRNDTLVFQWAGPEHNRYDIVGDVHGLLDELLVLLRKAGYVYEDGKLSHPQGRKLLFLGDLVDRGTQSLELVRFVRKAVADGVALCIKGNHEAKLVKFYQRFHATGVATWGSYANAETGLAFVNAKDGAALIEFLHGLPTSLCYVQDTLASDQSLRLLFAHANVYQAIPGITAQDDYVYGQTGFERPDTDAMYQERYDAGVNRWTLIRGHVPQTSEQENVFSLERTPFQKGELVLMRLDSFEAGISKGLTQREAFAESILTQKCEFDFEAYSAKYALSRALAKLASEKKVTGQVDESSRLRVFKYSKATFWNNSWSESAALLKARGIVLDAAGAIVSHPFDKVFNLHENGTGDDLPDDTMLVVPDKLNGFLGIVSAHPFQPGQLLPHTQGGFGGEFVGYLKSFITPEVGGRMKKYFARNNVTLMFEVLHPEDPHIIEYPESEQGLWLLGVRGKAETDQPWPEHLVDEAAQEMGLRRPKWTRMTKAALLAMCRTDTGLAKVEGWMAREDTAEQRPLFKLKTPYYLVTKFLGRLSSKRIAHMFSSPQDFKKTVDEEFYPLVDALTARLTKEEMLQMDDSARVPFVRDLVHELI